MELPFSIHGLMRGRHSHISIKVYYDMVIGLDVD